MEREPMPMQPMRNQILSGEEDRARTARTGRAGARRRRRRCSRLLLGLALLALIGGLVWRGARAQSPIGPPAMPLAYEFIASPNFGERPVNAPINMVVLHATVIPTTEGTISRFLDPVAQVSAHFVVGKDGRIVQMVPLEKRAWHAGVSTWDGVKDINNVSVGIEMVNLNDGKDPYPEPQVQAVAGIIRFIRSRYSVPDNHIVSHAQVALPQGRKSDPVGFDFERIKTLAHVLPQPPTPLPPNLPAVNPTPPVPPIPAPPKPNADPPGKP